MYKTFTQIKSATVTAVATAALLFAGTALAGPPDDGKARPGKPGKNGIVDGGTIVEIALAVNGSELNEFNALLSAVECFGPLTGIPGDNDIIDLLNGSDKYTLFAPTDAAFVNLLTRLEVIDPCDLDDENDTLYTVLTYHVVEGRRFSNSVFNANDAKMIETSAGVDFTSYVTMDGVPMLHDMDAQEIGLVAPFFNINAVNGVIHVIDTVLLPIDIPEEE